MARISSYPSVTPTASDLVLISDTSVTNNPTKTATVSSILNLDLNYTVYVASLLQTGTAAPVATVLKNTTGATFTWARTTTGKFTLTASTAVLTATKVVIFENATGDLNLGGKITSTTAIEVDQFSSGGGGYADGMLAGTSIEVRIYS